MLPGSVFKTFVGINPFIFVIKYFEVSTVVLIVYMWKLRPGDVSDFPKVTELVKG